MIRRILGRPSLSLAICLVALGILVAVAPVERTLGSRIRIVYLHGVWVWTALTFFLIASSAGLLGFFLKRPGLHRLSRGLGLTGLSFWITGLPIEMWAMQATWNGLFLAEPRWRVAISFAIGGLFLQVGLTLLNDLSWISACNTIFTVLLFSALWSTPNRMHPPTPIWSSHAPVIQIFFIGLQVFAFLSAWQVFRWWWQRSK